MSNQTTTKSIAGLHTIDITAKQWFDKVNGNSYFSAIATVNFGTPEAIEIKIPFQYGYGSQYEYTAFKALQDAKIIPTQDTMLHPSRFCQEYGIILRSNIETKCKKKDVIAHGK